ncbi:hypothetical protein [Galactobacillus timonensis]|uniref:hypothetical protein n=1 Tax=Galactobacillus timonensis TaxID=2041840 RepID=UPI000C860F56|nr:hypothetical protein [Galactobacillus timonensis]
MDNDDNVTNTEETTANQTTVATETGNGTNDQGNPEVSKNGQDGGGNNEEAGEQHYTLDEILKADPAIKAEYDRKMQAAIAKHDARLARGNSNGVQQEVGWKQEGKKS